MRYIGGKGKISRQLAEVIREHTDASVIYEPFMGGGAMTAALAPVFGEVLAGDSHEDIALMWQAVLDGWEPPEISEERYRELRGEQASAERGFAGSGGSFGGRWFGGFARGGYDANGTPRNHQAESARAVLRDRDNMWRGRVSVFHKSYDAWPLGCGERAAIYCDPPYAVTGESGLYEGEFDSAEFWVWAERQSAHHDVFVSEYEAPDGWVAIWEREKRQSLVIGSGNRDIRVEKLFVFKGRRGPGVMTEEKLIGILNEILMNHETGPLSNLGSSLELNEDELYIEVATDSVHPFSDTIDTPQLARELLAAVGWIGGEDERKGGSL